MSFTINEFQQSLLADTKPPEFTDPLLTAVWYGLRHEWEQAHTIAQEISGQDGARVHAWLHRIEGDEFNAGYWYRLAGISPAQETLHEEGMMIAEHLLSR